MVVKVSANEISAKERSTGEVVSIPHGMVVWSTGIGPRPEILEFMKQLGQVCFFLFPSLNLKARFGSKSHNFCLL